VNKNGGTAIHHLPGEEIRHERGVGASIRSEILREGPPWLMDVKKGVYA
jgi:hypothetical protein